MGGFLTSKESITLPSTPHIIPNRTNALGFTSIPAIMSIIIALLGILDWQFGPIEVINMR
jgi:hypothetical protein